MCILLSVEERLNRGKYQSYSWKRWLNDIVKMRRASSEEDNRIDDCFVMCFTQAPMRACNQMNIGDLASCLSVYLSSYGISMRILYKVLSILLTKMSALSLSIVQTIDSFFCILKSSNKIIKINNINASNYK
jgi:hypothetical protein